MTTDFPRKHSSAVNACCVPAPKPSQVCVFSLRKAHRAAACSLQSRLVHVAGQLLSPSPAAQPHARCSHPADLAGACLTRRCLNSLVGRLTAAQTTVLLAPPRSRSIRSGLASPVLSLFQNLFKKGETSPPPAPPSTQPPASEKSPGTAQASSSVLNVPLGKPRTKALALCAAACVRPHPEKVAKGGEDSHCVRLPAPKQPGGGGLVAVLDGVSGWSVQGVDTAAYSRRLARCLADAALVADTARGEAGEGSGDSLNALALLTAAHASTRISGASTACVCILDGTAKKMSTCNLGDSGWLLLRGGQIVGRSSPQQHVFDCPYQLSSPKYVPNTDTPDMGDCATVDVEEGDLLLLASDGLWDNADMGEILAVTAAAYEKGAAAEPRTGQYSAAAAVCSALVDVAWAHSQDDKFDSPYALAARKLADAEREASKASNPFAALATAFGQDPASKWQTQGGKWDDVTVVAAVVCDADTAAASLNAARDAAAASLRVEGGVPSACGDATAESRRMFLGLTDADEADELAERLAAKAAAKQKEAAASASLAAASFRPLFGEREVLSMDAAACRKALAAANLPSSGKLDILRARVLTIPA
jgi:serine/threonine protein phosphatase PrpC